MSEVTRDLVRLHTEYYGKGPTKARSYRVNDMLISILEGGFTTVETHVDRRGAVQTRSMSMRRSFQLAMEDRFRAVVEKATGRRVIAYMSQIHTDPDMAVELFVLEPRVRGRSRRGRSASRTHRDGGAALRNQTAALVGSCRNSSLRASSIKGGGRT